MKHLPIYERIDADLARRRAEHRFRTLPAFSPRPSIDLSLNSYLNLHRNAEVAANARLLTDNNFSGNGASRLVSQGSPLFDRLEAEIADWKGTEAALLFNSGYAANLGILQALCTRDTEVFSDRLNHASITDGIRLSGARLARYSHNDMEDLSRRLGRSTSREKIIVTDSVFSMDGDRAKLEDICTLARSYGCMVMVDEAHATGVFGHQGRGLADEAGVADEVDIRMGTLSKAVAGVGGFFAGSRILKDYFVNHARSFVYSTGLPHCGLAHDLSAIGYIRRERTLGASLYTMAVRFRATLAASGFDTMQSDTQIVPCLFKQEAIALNCSEFLAARGINAPAIRPPTVPHETSRVRFSLHAGLEAAQLAHVCNALEEWKRSRG